MSFVTEFRKNIPYIADDIAEFLMGRDLIDDTAYTSKGTRNKLMKQIEEGLVDWLNEYQTEEARDGMEIPE